MSLAPGMFFISSNTCTHCTFQICLLEGWCNLALVHDLFETSYCYEWITHGGQKSKIKNVFGLGHQ